ncbi:MAG TPA: hypothetical protein VFP55_10950, partial [Solirubrobacteraceae bacterium]|nr:hypothetical protein [Solirubrobacteraceae bacterium]
MTALWLIVGFILGAAVVALTLRPRLRGLSAEVAAGRDAERRSADARAALERDLVQARADLEHE